MTAHAKYTRKVLPDKNTPRGPGFDQMSKEKLAEVLLRNRTPIEVRFWWDVDKSPHPTGCWMWRGALFATGHGQVGYKGRTRRAHHISLMLAGRNPEVPGTVVDHMCRNRACVNPDHLRIVPERVNGLENNDSPFAQNARRHHCKVCGKPLSGENLAVVPYLRKKTKHGYLLDQPVLKHGRQCLSCYPGLWRHAAIPRPRPPGSRDRKSVV